MLGGITIVHASTQYQFQDFCETAFNKNPT